MSEGVFSVVLSHGKDGIFKGLDESRDGISALLFEKRFKLGEEVLDRVVVRRIARQLAQFTARGLDQLSYLGVMVDGEVIHDDNLSSFKCRD